VELALREADRVRARIGDIARAAHEVNRAYCESIGDTSQLPWDQAPTWQWQSAEDGVRKILSGEVTTPEQAHESWLVFKRADGWGFGPVKDPETKSHPCMVPYAELPQEQRVKDALFFAVVRAFA
jgi:hypothetical protein